MDSCHVKGVAKITGDMIGIKKSKRQMKKWIRREKTLMLRDLSGSNPIFPRLFLLNKTLDIVLNNNREEPSFSVGVLSGRAFSSEISDTLEKSGKPFCGACCTMARNLVPVNLRDDGRSSRGGRARLLSVAVVAAGVRLISSSARLSSPSCGCTSLCRPA